MRRLLPSPSTKARGRRDRLAAPTSAEAALARALTRQGISYRREHQIAGSYVDFWIPRARLAVEVDGPHHHDVGHQMGRDVVKTNALCAQGISVLRFTNADVLASPDHAARRVADVIAAQTRAVPLFTTNRPRASRRRSGRTTRTRTY